MINPEKVREEAVENAKENVNPALRQQETLNGQARSLEEAQKTPAEIAAEQRIAETSFEKLAPNEQAKKPQTTYDIIKEKGIQDVRDQTIHRIRIDEYGSDAKSGDSNRLGSPEGLGQTGQDGDFGHPERGEIRNRGIDRTISGYGRRQHVPSEPGDTSPRSDLRSGYQLEAKDQNAPEVSFETPTERNSKYDKEVKRYYNKYGDDFYEKMPDNLKEHYDSMLDAQPRDKDGCFVSPTYIESLGLKPQTTYDIIKEKGIQDVRDQTIHRIRIDEYGSDAKSGDSNRLGSPEGLGQARGQMGGDSDLGYHERGTGGREILTSTIQRNGYRYVPQQSGDEAVDSIIRSERLGATGPYQYYTTL